jgi:hypothetical protein
MTPAWSPRPLATPTEAVYPVALLRTKSYRGLLVLAAVLGVPISAAAYGFLYLIDKL